MTYLQFTAIHFTKTTKLFQGLQVNASDRRKVKHWFNRIAKVTSKGRAMADCQPEVRAPVRMTTASRHRAVAFIQRGLRRLGAK